MFRSNAKRSLDFIISTVNVDLEWNKYLSALRPKGTLCLVGATMNPIPVSAFSLIGGQKRIVGNPTGSPHVMNQMFDFAARHDLGAIVQSRPMSQANEAIEDHRVRAPENGPTPPPLIGSLFCYLCLVFRAALTLRLT